MAEYFRCPRCGLQMGHHSFHCRKCYFESRGMTESECIDIAEDVDGDPTLPTMHPPGSYEKMAVMAARDRLGIPLFHPEDFVPTGEESTGGLLASLLPQSMGDRRRVSNRKDSA